VPEPGRIVIPNAWDPRPHQLPFWAHMTQGGLRAVAVWHRRAGKDSTALNWTAVAAHQRVGSYLHMLPEAAQARKAIWLAIDKQGRRVIDQAFPHELRARTVDQEMFIEFKNGSTWGVAGSDNYNSLVGTNYVGVTFSEYSVGNPAAWDYLRPILTENGGWAVFIYTPRGRNHGRTLYQMAERNPDWFAELLSVEDTQLIPPEAIQAERDAGMDDDMIQQEFFCSWEGVRQGSIFGTALAEARRAGRVGSYPYDPRSPVNTFWDIGHSDTTAIWFHQQVQGEDRFIHAYEASGEDVPFFVRYLKDRGYLYGQHFLPHDCKNTTLAAKSNPLGKNVWDQMFGLGMRDLVRVDRTPDVWTSINLTRTRMGTATFDEAGCGKGLDALESYHKKWDDARKSYSNEPVHDWSSNYADALRQWADGWRAKSASTITFPSFSGAPANLPVNAPRVSSVGNRRVGY
jgi:phage terminase large subunit